MNTNIYTKKILWQDGDISYHCFCFNINHPGSIGFFPNFKIRLKHYFDQFGNIKSKLDWLNKIKNI